MLRTYLRILSARVPPPTLTLCSHCYNIPSRRRGSHAPPVRDSSRRSQAATSTTSTPCRQNWPLLRTRGIALPFVLIGPRGHRHADIDWFEVTGRKAPAHPRGGVARHRDPPVLRPPAAGAGRRVPPVSGRSGGSTQAGHVVHPDGGRRHGGAHPAHVQGGRQGAAGRDGAAADQPPAGLPDLRQGRRVPAAEPGSRPAGPTPASPRTSGISRSPCTSPASAAGTGSAACCASGPRFSD